MALFFSILQAALWAVTCLAVQRSALAAARHAARADSTGGPAASPQVEAYAALLPLSAVHPTNTLSLAFTRVEVTRTAGRVEATVRYPMPLRIPLAGRWLGQKLPLTGNPADTPSGRAVVWAFRLAGRRFPGFPDPGIHLPYFRMVCFSADTPEETPRSGG